MYKWNVRIHLSNEIQIKLTLYVVRRRYLRVISMRVSVRLIVNKRHSSAFAPTIWQHRKQKMFVSWIHLSGTVYIFLAWFLKKLCFLVHVCFSLYAWKNVSQGALINACFLSLPPSFPLSLEHASRSLNQLNAFFTFVHFSLNCLICCEPFLLLPLPPSSYVRLYSLLLLSYYTRCLAQSSPQLFY